MRTDDAAIVTLQPSTSLLPSSATTEPTKAARKKPTKAAHKKSTKAARKKPTGARKKKRRVPDADTAEWLQDIWRSYGTGEVSEPSSPSSASLSSDDFPWGADSPDEPLEFGGTEAGLPLFRDAEHELLTPGTAEHETETRRWSTLRTDGQGRTKPYRQHHFRPHREERIRYREARHAGRGREALLWKKSGRSYKRPPLLSDIKLPPAGPVEKYLRRRRKCDQTSNTHVVTHFGPIDDVFSPPPQRVNSKIVRVIPAAAQATSTRSLRLRKRTGDRHSAAPSTKNRRTVTTAAGITVSDVSECAGHLDADEPIIELLDSNDGGECDDGREYADEEAEEKEECKKKTTRR